MPAAKIYLSVLKWSLLSTGCIPMEKLAISTEDVCNLIDERIPIFVDKPNAAQVTVPLILALEGPPGMMPLTFFLTPCHFTLNIYW